MGCYMTDLINGRITLDRFRGLVAVGGFSYADVPESAKGWAAATRFNEKLRKMFEDFIIVPIHFLWGLQRLPALRASRLGPLAGDRRCQQPRFVQNVSGRFESRWVNVKILESPAIMFEGMVGSTLGIWVAHGEGGFVSRTRP